MKSQRVLLLHVVFCWGIGLTANILHETQMSNIISAIFLFLITIITSVYFAMHFVEIGILILRTSWFKKCHVHLSTQAIPFCNWHLNIKNKITILHKTSSYSDMSNPSNRVIERYIQTIYHLSFCYQPLIRKESNRLLF